MAGSHKTPLSNMNTSKPSLENTSTPSADDLEPRGTEGKESDGLIFQRRKRLNSDVSLHMEFDAVMGLVCNIVNPAKKMQMSPEGKKIEKKQETPGQELVTKDVMPIAADKKFIVIRDKNLNIKECRMMNNVTMGKMHKVKDNGKKEIFGRETTSVSKQVKEKSEDGNFHSDNIPVPKVSQASGHLVTKAYLANPGKSNVPSQVSIQILDKNDKSAKVVKENPKCANITDRVEKIDGLDQQICGFHESKNLQRILSEDQDRICSEDVSSKNSSAKDDFKSKIATKISRKDKVKDEPRYVSGKNQVPSSVNNVPDKLLKIKQEISRVKSMIDNANASVSSRHVKNRNVMKKISHNKLVKDETKPGLKDVPKNICDGTDIPEKKVETKNVALTTATTKIMSRFDHVNNSNKTLALSKQDSLNNQDLKEQEVPTSESLHEKVQANDTFGQEVSEMETCEIKKKGEKCSTAFVDDDPSYKAVSEMVSCDIKMEGEKCSTDVGVNTSCQVASEMVPCGIKKIEEKCSTEFVDDVKETDTVREDVDTTEKQDLDFAQRTYNQIMKDFQLKPEEDEDTTDDEKKENDQDQNASDRSIQNMSDSDVKISQKNIKKIVYQKCSSFSERNNAGRRKPKVDVSPQLLKILNSRCQEKEAAVQSASKRIRLEAVQSNGQLSITYDEKKAKLSPKLEKKSVVSLKAFKLGLSDQSLANSKETCSPNIINLRGVNTDRSAKRSSTRRDRSLSCSEGRPAATKRRVHLRSEPNLDTDLMFGEGKRRRVIITSTEEKRTDLSKDGKQLIEDLRQRMRLENKKDRTVGKGLSWSSRKRDTFGCMICYREFTFFEDCLLHLDSDHSDPNRKKICLPENIEKVKMFTCCTDNCEDIFRTPSLNLMMAHQRIRHRELGLKRMKHLSFCQVCKGEHFEDDEALSEHLVKEHGLKLDTGNILTHYYCIACDRPVGNTIAWDAHKKKYYHIYKFGQFTMDENNQGEGILSIQEGIGMDSEDFAICCSIQGQMSGSQISTPVSGPGSGGKSRRNVIQCINCPEEFIKSKIDSHVSKCHPNSTFKCEYRYGKTKCGRELVTAPNMLKHLAVHDTSIKRIYDACVRRLLQVPDDLRWFRCQICGMCLNGQRVKIISDHVKTKHSGKGEQQKPWDLHPYTVVDFGCRICGVISQGKGGYNKLINHITECSRKHRISVFKRMKH